MSLFSKIVETIQGMQAYNQGYTAGEEYVEEGGYTPVGDDLLLHMSQHGCLHDVETKNRTAFNVGFKDAASEGN